MKSNLNIIWKKGDDAMPEHAKHVVEAAQNELLLKTLQIPSEIADLLRYYADKNAQTVNDYISAILVEHMTTV